jgi:hypothetical protein|tara:strand:- start:1700 stop:1987 length:288 start_codon:yes stop_codon:yes gene_type:complete
MVLENKKSVSLSFRFKTVVREYKIRAAREKQERLLALSRRGSFGARASIAGWIIERRMIIHQKPIANAFEMIISACSLKASFRKEMIKRRAKKYE